MNNFDSKISRIKEAAGLESFDVFVCGQDYNPHIKVYEIVVKADERGQGKGSKAMESLVNIADSLGLDIHLIPDSRTAGGSGSKKAHNRLIRWYKRFGFQENKGKRYDYRYRGGMIRYPMIGD